MVEIEDLQSHALFGGITDENMKAIRKMLKQEHFSEGELIAEEGRQGDRLYFICEGSVEILKNVPGQGETEQVRLAVRRKWDTICEMEIIDIQPRSASVRALEEVSALSLSHGDLYEIYKSNRDTFILLVLNIAREISRKLRGMDALVSSALFSKPGEPETSKPGPQGSPKP